MISEDNEKFSEKNYMVMMMVMMIMNPITFITTSTVTSTSPTSSILTKIDIIYYHYQSMVNCYENAINKTMLILDNGWKQNNIINRIKFKSFNNPMVNNLAWQLQRLQKDFYHFKSETGRTRIGINERDLQNLENDLKQYGKVLNNYVHHQRVNCVWSAFKSEGFNGLRAVWRPNLTQKSQQLQNNEIIINNRFNCLDIDECNTLS